MKNNNTSMLQGNLLSSILRYTIPIFLTSVLQLLFHAADLVVVGRYCGSISVGAVGSTGAITNLIVNVFMGLSVGAGVTVAHGLGCRDDVMVHRTVHTALPTALVSSAILTVVGVTCSESLLRLMATPEDVLALSALYMRIYFLGITFTLVYNFSAAILRAAGDTKSPLIFLSIAGVINVALNVVFIRVFGMNVEGVALATVISQGIAMVLVVRALMRRTDACKLELKKMRFYKHTFLRIASLGLPAGIQSSLFSISNVLIQSSVNSFGEALIAGNAAAGSIEGFQCVTVNAFHHAALNFTGQNAGAGQYKRVRKILMTCLGCVTVAGLAVGMLAWIFAPELLSIYITDSPEAIAYGILRMNLLCPPYFIFGLMDVVTGVLRGLGTSITPMIISVAGICVMRIAWISTIFQIPQFHTPACLYLSYPISWLITFLCQFVAFLIIYRKKSKAYQPLA